MWPDTITDMHFCQGICDLICEKWLLLEDLKQQFCVYILLLYIYSQSCIVYEGVFWSVLTFILLIIRLNAFDRSGSLLQIKWHFYDILHLVYYKGHTLIRKQLDYGIHFPMFQSLMTSIFMARARWLSRDVMYGVSCLIKSQD